MSQPSASENTASIVKAEMGGVPDSYIVMLKDESDQSSHIRWISRLHERYSSSDVVCKVNFEYTIFKGYSAQLNGAALEEVARSGDVKGIYQNQELEYEGENEGEAALGKNAKVVQKDTAWGLQRISQKAELPAGSDPDAVTYNYRYEQQVQPKAVDVYVIDSGVYVEHHDFGGRATWGPLLPDQTKVDTVGHGTHVAGIVGGNRWGAAKTVKIIAMKTSKDGQPPTTDYTVKCFDSVIQQAGASKRPSIINYSVSGPASVPLDTAAEKALAAGVHVCAAAGNQGVDASTRSPGRAPGVVTVGAINIDDTKRAQSNYGSVLTIFAPGQNITSAATTGLDATTRKSGTSMAAPHVAGVMAYIMSMEGSMSPVNLRQRIKNLGIAGVLGHIGAESPNLLLNNGEKN